MGLTSLWYTPSIKSSMSKTLVFRNLTGLFWSTGVITPPLTELSKQKQLSWSEGQVCQLHSGICSLHTSGLHSIQRRHVKKKKCLKNRFLKAHIKDWSGFLGFSPCLSKLSSAIIGGNVNRACGPSCTSFQGDNTASMSERECFHTFVFVIQETVKYQ